LDDQAWAEFLYMRTNTKGIYAERWRHSRGCGGSSTPCATRPPTIFWPSTRPARHSPRSWGRARRPRGARAPRERGDGGFRTPSGGRVDRAQRIRFEFDGRTYEGLAGDTLASALLANGVHLTGRSFKYHRPRGILAAGSEEPNALVTVSRDAARVTPNLRATQVELYRA